MYTLNYIEILAALAGLALSLLLAAFPRFAAGSWMLVLILVPASFSSAVLGVAPLLGWLPEDVVFASFTGLLLCAAAGCMASYILERANFRSELQKNRWFFISVSAAAPILAGTVHLFRPTLSDPTPGLIALGPGGYAGAGYLLVVSIVTLANIEQTLRSAEEHIRWEIKFLLLGIASMFGAIIYVASQTLLYPPEYAFLPVHALEVFPIIFLCGCCLILQSWRRSTGRGRVVVSQGVVYSTITLFSVGVYLVGTSLIARWFSTWTHPSVPLEPIIFLVSAIALAAVLLGTAFQHRFRRWIRRNIFAGNYDYRQLWMDTTERVRSIDSNVTTATALAQIIHDALGSIDISVWLRTGDMHVMRPAFARGTISETLMQDVLQVADIPPSLNEPMGVAEFGAESVNRWAADFFERAKASLVVPLVSAGRLVGLLTVGPDRSGRGLDREAREFLRVLAVHAASEFHK